MKKLILITLLLSSCGDSHDTSPLNPTPYSEALVSPSPSPSRCNDESVIGNWVGANTLTFNQDCTATFGDNKFTWIVNGKDIEFKSGNFQIDQCAYEVIAQGGLSSNLIILLDLICDKAGILKYTLSP